jgi:thiol:disulfide interchange protein DsbA
MQILHLIRQYHSLIMRTVINKAISFTRIKRVPPCRMILIGYILISFIFNGSSALVYAADDASAPSYGKGAWELIVFTDYFCPPCQTVEKDLEPEIERLLARGDVKITFVDFPGHKHSSLYAKYFLGAVAADKSYANAMKARHILFSLAAKKNIERESDLAASLRSEGITLKMIDPKPVYKEWSTMIKRYDINQTPTCLLRFSSTYTKKYSDGDQIKTGLIPELQKRFPMGKK